MKRFFRIGVFLGIFFPGLFVSCGGTAPESLWFDHKGNPGYLSIDTPPPAVAGTGSFTVEGRAVNNFLNYVWIRVELENPPEDEDWWYYDFMVRGGAGGNFAQEIWLRFGPGPYRVRIFNLSMLKASLKGEGFLYTWAGYWNSGTEYTVYNGKPDADKNDYHLLPSGDIQVNAPEIQAVLDDIYRENGLNPGSVVTDKLRAINHWVTGYLHYDHESWSEDGGRDPYRKKQDALSTLRSRTGVCEGYANLTAALARAAGIRTVYVVSEPMEHAWIHVWDGSKWKLLDATWNDPDRSFPGSEEKYFMLTDGQSTTHHSWYVDVGRSMAGNGGYGYAEVERFPGK